MQYVQPLVGFNEARTTFAIEGFVQEYVEADTRSHLNVAKYGNDLACCDMNAWTMAWPFFAPLLLVFARIALEAIQVRTSARHTKCNIIFFGSEELD